MIKDETIITAFSILSITTLGVINMVYFGINSTIFGLIIAIVAGLAGFELGIINKNIKNK